jgi:hypothetical protein
MTLSRQPRKTRRVTKLAKFEAAPWHIKIMDQKKIVVDRYLPMGNLTKPTEPGKHAAR